MDGREASGDGWRYAVVSSAGTEAVQLMTDSILMLDNTPLSMLEKMLSPANRISDCKGLGRVLE